MYHDQVQRLHHASTLDTIHLYNVVYDSNRLHIFSMRSFFKKPAWAKTDDEPSAPEFYRRSHQTYKDIVKANREQRREEAAKSSLQKTVEVGSPRLPTRYSKRRRISDQDDEPIEDVPEKNETQSNASSPPSEQSSASSSVEFVESRIQTEDIDNDGDEAALEQELQAAERQRATSRAVQAIEKPSRSPDTIPSSRPVPSPENGGSKLSSRDELTTNPAKAKVADDIQEDTDGEAGKKDEVVVDILVTSEMENTKPLIVRRLMSQRFRDIRLTWCARQGFDQDMTDTVYLTWNKRRLFDVTTCKSLDIKSPSSISLDPDFEDESRDVLRIHVEAVTDEFLKARAEAEKLALEPPVSLQTADSDSFHIVLKSPGFGDLRVKVLPRTPVQQIMDNFRSKRNIPAGKEIHLSFDGDILDSSAQLKDCDIDDMDLVEVILR